MESSEQTVKLSFSNTEIAFADKTNKELKRMHWLFKLMNNPALVNIATSIGLVGVKYSLPFAKAVVKNTIFKQFCGGESLLDSQGVIDRLHRSNILTVLDYGAEGRSGEEELDKVAEGFMNGVEFAASNVSVPVVSIKLTAIGEDAIMEKYQQEGELTESEKRTFEQLRTRLDDLCKYAQELGVSVFIDAEESWMQITIDELADEMMAKYNKERVVVYNTFQLYRNDKLQFLKDSHAKSLKEGYLLGAKLVRGAYMGKERRKAEELGYPSPIHENKEATDKDFDDAIRYCVDHYDTIALCAATHNEKSSALLAQLITEGNIQPDHPHLNFSQLMGMSDNISFNLASSGFNVAKYVVYGKVQEVLPYLARRAKENTSVTGDMSRELGFISEEMRRRGLKK